MNRKRAGDSPIFTEKWTIIEEAVECAFNNEVSRYSFQSVHHAVFQVCQAKLGEMLLESLQELFSSQGKKLADKLRMTKTSFFLEEFVVLWEDYAVALHRIGSLLLYFRNYLTATHRPSVKDIGEHTFCVQVLSDAEIQRKLNGSVQESINDMGKWSILHEYSRILLDVDRGAFYPDFENVYLEVVGSKCSEEGRWRSSHGSVEEYLVWVKNTLAQQEGQIANLLSPSSVFHLRQWLLETLIGAAEYYLLFSDTGCVSMLHAWNFRGIRRVVEAFDKRGNIAGAVNALATEVKKLGTEILGDTGEISTNVHASADAVVGHTLALLRNCEKLSAQLPRAGSSSVETSPVLRVLHDVINNSPKFPDKLSLYYDSHIRRADSVSIQQLSSDVLSLFRVLRDRDGFEICFRNHLAARIMHAKPEGLEMEGYFINRMKEECGPAAVSRLEKMITDVKDATSLQGRLKAAMASSNYTLPLEFRTSVLTAGFWPQYASLAFTLPDAMQTCIAVFQQFYTSRHNGRKLSFQLSLGTVGFNFRHAGEGYVVSAPTPFVCVLNSLNADGDISMDRVSGSSGLSRGDIVAQVATLSKYGLVTMSSNPSSAGTYRFNQSFSSPVQRIRIGAGPHKITKEANIYPSGRTSLEASHIMGLESAIVKVLKTSKTVDHETLCQSVEEILRPIFTPTRPEIKERVDALIEKGFLTRGNRSGLYVYSS